MKPPEKAFVWRHDYQYRDDDRKVFRAMIVEDYPDEDAIPLASFVAYIKTIWDAIPEEWRRNAFIKLGREDSDYGTAADFDVYLERLETDAEFAERKQKEAAEEKQAARAQEARERGMLAALKKKYG